MSALEKASQHAKKLKIDEYEIVFVKRKVLTIRITDSTIAEIKQNKEQSLGIRVIHQKKIAVSQTKETHNVEKLIEKTLKQTTYVKPHKFWNQLPIKSKSKKIERTYDKKLSEITLSKAADIATSMINAAYHKKIESVSGSLNIVSENFCLVNSNNLEISDNATYISGVINTDIKTGIQLVSGIGQECSRTAKAFKPEKVGLAAAEMCLNSLNPQNCPNSTCSVIFEPYSVGEILAFVVAPNFTLKMFSEKKSCFAENLGQQIASENFTLSDRPHMPEGIGSKSFDDEGVPTKDISLIENGFFKNTISNLFDAYKEKKQTTGNAIRAGTPLGRDSLPMPTCLPHNITIEKGDSNPDELIKDTKKGILVGRLWYTYALNPIKGDFSCTARSGIRIIENGKIINAGKPARIIHNLPKLLENISQIGNDSKRVLQWSSLPSITPSIKVEKIKIIPII